MPVWIRAARGYTPGRRRLAARDGPRHRCLVKRQGPLRRSARWAARLPGSLSRLPAGQADRNPRRIRRQTVIPKLPSLRKEGLLGHQRERKTAARGHRGFWFGGGAGAGHRMAPGYSSPSWGNSRCPVETVGSGQHSSGGPCMGWCSGELSRSRQDPRQSAPMPCCWPAAWAVRCGSTPLEPERLARSPRGRGLAREEFGP